MGGRFSEIALTLAGDEENLSALGTGWLLQHLPHASDDANIRGEDGSPRVVRFGEKGLMWVEVEATGSPARGHHHGGPRREAREGIDPMRCLTGLNIVAVDINAVSPPQDDNGMAAHLCAHKNSEALTVLCRQPGLAPRGRIAGRPPVPGRCVQRHRIRAPRSPPPGTR